MRGAGQYMKLGVGVFCMVKPNAKLSPIPNKYWQGLKFHEVGEEGDDT